MTRSDGIRIGGYPLSTIVRRVRRTADLSQRELATRAGISGASVARFETGALTPSLAVLQRMLVAADYQLVVVDGHGRLVLPLAVWDELSDAAGRRFPAHLDTILDPRLGEWWADGFGLARPPETFRRNRAHRDHERRRSQWEVRVAALRHAPPPRLPPGWGPADRLSDDESEEW